MLTAEDLKFLDSVEMSEEEMHGRRGRNRGKRRPSRKTLSDLAFLMTYVTRKVEAAGEMAEAFSLDSVDRMFTVVAEEFEGGRNAQMHWASTVHLVRRSLGNAT